MNKISEQKALEAYPMNEYEFDKAKKSDIERKRFAYIKGYDQAMQDFLEKACEYLRTNLGNYFNGKKQFVEQFKKYMEDK